MPRVGVLWHAGSAEEEAIYLGALLDGFKAIGYVEGRTIALEHRFPNEIPEQFVSLAAELAALNPDVLVAVTRPAAVAAQRATTSIPTVFIVVPDPIGTKLVSSLARPGGNITGLTHIAVELSAKRLAFFKEAFPNASGAALMVNGNDPQGMRRYSDKSYAAAAALGMTVRPVEVRSLADFDAAFDNVVAEHLARWCAGACRWAVLPGQGATRKIGNPATSSTGCLFARDIGSWRAHVLWRRSAGDLPSRGRLCR